MRRGFRSSSFRHLNDRSFMVNLIIFNGFTPFFLVYREMALNGHLATHARILCIFRIQHKRGFPLTVIAPTGILWHKARNPYIFPVLSGNLTRPDKHRPDNVFH